MHLDIIANGSDLWVDLSNVPTVGTRLIGAANKPFYEITGEPNITMLFELPNGAIALAGIPVAFLRRALIVFESSAQNPVDAGHTRSLPAQPDYAGLAQLSPVDLLAWLVYGEAEGEAQTAADGELPKGQLAVAHTVLNRAKKARWWGRDVKSVILCPGQYDGLRRIPLPAGPPPPALRTLAQLVIDGHTIDPTPGATHFLPTWKEKPWDLPEVARIGNHKFFREV